MSKKTLLLDASYQVLSFIPERKVFKLLFKDKVEVESTWDEDITWGSGRMKRPSVVRLKKHVRRNYFNSNFSRKALVKRDRSTCFTPNTKILMEDGSIKSIQDIEIGDRIIDHQGNIQNVEYVRSKSINETILNINVRGNGVPLQVTKEHKILTTSWDNSCVDTDGIQANLLNKDNYLFNICYTPKIVVDQDDLFRFNNHLKYIKTDSNHIKYYNSKYHNRYFEYNYHLGRIFGFFLAEGSLVNKDRGIIFSFHINEEKYTQEIYDYFLNIFGIEGKILLYPDRNVRTIRIGSKLICSLFKRTLYKDDVKSFSCKRFNKKFLTGLLTGMLDGDGFFNEKNKNVVLMLKLDNLISDFLIISNMLGIYPTTSKIYYRKDGRKFQSLIFQAQEYNKIISICNRNLSKYDKVSKIDRNIINGSIISKIDNISEMHYAGLVFDLQVSGTHTYIANGIAVHNCQYCGKKLTVSQITIDHVLPRAQGGITSFVNCVVCCQICNNKKADRTPEQASMMLLKKPTHPSFSAHHYVADPQEHWHTSWDDFLSN